MKLIKSLLLASLGAIALNGAAKDYRITDHGVWGNDSTLIQTAAIQNVIDRAEADGGGTVIVPKGIYLTGALFFKPGTKLHLEEGACIKGVDDIAHYPLIPSRMEGRSIYYYAALINAYNVDGFSITGPGMINGNGLRFWKQFWDLRADRKKIGKGTTNLEVKRPRLVFIWGSDHVKLSGPHFCNSPFWTTHFYQCSDVLIENCRITAPNAPVKAPSSDAIDLDVCRDVVVRGCYLDCNDDGVCIKGGKGVRAHLLPESGMVENVLVENCTFGPALHGTLTMGSECVHAKNITLRNCKLETNTSILRLKMRPDTYQIYENITVENVTGKCGTVIEMAPWKQFFDLEGTDAKPYAQVRNITIKNVDVKCQDLGTIHGNPDDTVKNFLMENIHVEASKPGFDCIYPDVKLENVTMNGEKVVNPAKNVRKKSSK